MISIFKSKLGKKKIKPSPKPRASKPTKAGDFVGTCTCGGYIKTVKIGMYNFDKCQDCEM